MVGQGKPEDIKGDYHFENIWYYNFGMNPRLEIQNNEFGPEFGISKELEKHFPEKKFILIKYAIGGASMLDWAPDYDRNRAEITGHPEYGNMYDSLLQKTEILTKGLTINTIGLVWMQGARDARVPEAGIEYYKNFRSFIISVRKDLNDPNLPVLFGKTNVPESLYPAVNTIIQAQERIAGELSRIYLINTDSLEKWNDNVHYSSDGQVKLGHEFGKKIVEILKN